MHFHGRNFIILSLILPVVSLSVALWGTTWGWNSDSRLYSQAAAYTAAAYALLLVPQGAVYLSREKLQRGRLALLGGIGQKSIIWGVDVLLVSALLIHAFDSDALWLGSMSNLYIGFFSILAGVILILGRASGARGS